MLEIRFDGGIFGLNVTGFLLQHGHHKLTAGAKCADCHFTTGRSEDEALPVSVGEAIHQLVENLPPNIAGAWYLRRARAKVTAPKNLNFGYQLWLPATP